MAGLIGKDDESEFRSPPILIKNVEVERVSTYTYLAFVLDEKLAWTAHVDSIIKKLNSRMFCLRKIGRFGVRT